VDNIVETSSRRYVCEESMYQLAKFKA
jgi:hypothetical protein